VSGLSTIHQHKIGRLVNFSHNEISLFTVFMCTYLLFRWQLISVSIWAKYHSPWS